jgi:heptaprenylglyceryl phosphate synthase
MNENVIAIITELLESGTDFVLIGRNDTVSGDKYSNVMNSINKLTSDGLNISVITF